MSEVCTATYYRQHIFQESETTIKKLIEPFRYDRVGKGFMGGPARPALALPLTGKGVQEYASGKNVFDRG